MIGSTVSHYRIVQKLGQGGMGVVYKAEDTRLPRTVALKFLPAAHSADEELVKRFFHEAAAASACDHQNICVVHDMDRAADGRAFIAMAWYPGPTVADRLDDGPLPLAEALSIAIGVADGLAHAHRNGIIHRDIKPANLILGEDGVAKIVDFGIARLTDRSTITEPGSVPGTLAYMSPEQATGESVDKRSDIFSLGTTLYEMVTGTSPFWAEHVDGLRYKLLTTDPPDVRTLRPDVPRSLERVVRRALRKAPADRYQTADALRDDLMDVLAEVDPSRVQRVHRIYRHDDRPWWKHRTGVAAMAMVAVAATLVFTVYGPTLWRQRPWFTPGNKGLVVLPFDVAGTAESGRAVATGLTIDLTERLAQSVEGDSRGWLVPASDVIKRDVTGAAAAGQAFGAGYALSGRVVSAGSGYEVRLSLDDARNGRSLRSTAFALSEDGHAGSAADRLRELLRATYRRAGSGPMQIPAADAYLPYLEATGWLEASEPRPDRAIELLDRSIAADPMFIGAKLRLADAYLRKFHDTKAEVWIDRALSTVRGTKPVNESDERLTLAALARALTAQGHADSALADLERVVELGPRDWTASRALYLAHVSAGRTDAAQHECERFIAAAPTCWAGHENLGYLHYVSGRPRQAIEEFTKVAKMAPLHASTYNYLGANYYILEDWGNAITMFEKSFNLKPNFEACSNLGTLYYMNGRFEDAALMYQWALEYHGPSHLLYGHLADAYARMPDKKAEARGLFQRAAALARDDLQSNHDDPLLWVFLGSYFVQLGSDSARACIERALQLGADDSEILYRAASACEQLGDRERALALLGAAIGKGYSLKEIQHEPEFANLRSDPRFALLLPGEEATSSN